MNKNLNNDISKDSPVLRNIWQYFQFFQRIMAISSSTLLKTEIVFVPPFICSPRFFLRFDLFFFFLNSILYFM